MADETAATNPATADQQPAAAAPTTPDTTVNVSTPAVAPVATQPATSDQMVQQNAAPDAPQLSAKQAPAPDNLAVKVYHGIMGALGGTEDTSYARDPQTGKMVATTTASGPGSQWKRIIAGVVQGTAAGLSVAPGPGQLERAAGAGVSSTIGNAQQQDQTKRSQANQDFDASQKALVAKAQTQALAYEGAVHAFQLTRMQVDANDQDAARENNFVKSIQGGGTGSQDLGVAKDFQQVMQMHKDMPGLMTQYANGNVIQVAHVNAEGKYDGNRFALVTPEWKDEKLDGNRTFYSLQPATKIGDDPQVIAQTVKAGTMSNGDFQNRQTAAANEILKWQVDHNKVAHQDRVDQSTIDKNESEITKNNAEAAKARKEAAAIPVAGDDMNDSEIVKGMIDGSVDITKTASIRGNSRAQYIAAAKQLDPNFNMQDYNAKLKTRLAFSGDGKQAQQIQSFNTFLGHAMDYSQSISSLRNSNSPLINKPVNWLKSHAAGNPAVNDLLIQQEAAKTEYQNFLNNNHALMAQDKESGEKMINNDMSPAQQQGAMKQFVTTAAIRMSAVNHTFYSQFGKDAPNMLDEDGKASLAHFGVPETMVYHHPTGVPSTPAAPTETKPNAKAPKPVTPPVGAQAEVLDPQGNLIGHAVNNKFVPLSGK